MFDQAPVSPTALAEGSSKLFVSNVPFDIDDQELFERFSDFGEVLAVKVVGTKNRKGCAFITYSNVSDAALARENLNNNLRFSNVSKINNYPLYIIHTY